MALPRRTALVLAVVASCALHGVVLWFFHTPARGIGGAKVRWKSSRLEVTARYLGVQPAKPTPPAPPAAHAPTPAPEPTPPMNPDPPTTTDATANTGPVGLVAPSDYLPTALLDVEPLVIQDIPSDPPELLGRTETGTIILTLLIGANGAVDDAVVESSDLPDIFAQVARRDFLGMRFNPGVRNGQPVPSTMRVEMTIGPPQAP